VQVSGNGINVLKKMKEKGILQKVNPQGTQVAQLVKRLTLDFGSGHNVRVVRSSPMSGSTLAVEHA